LTEHEKLGMFHYWREIGRRMNIKNIPEDFAEFERYNIEHERQNFRYAETNRRVGEATRDMFLNWFLPKPLHFLGAPFIYALMEDRLLEAFGFPKPSPLMRRFVEGALKLRARVIRLLPERRKPRLRMEMKHRSYPRGYKIEELGPSIPEQQESKPS
jgi:hypothetical protein